MKKTKTKRKKTQTSKTPSQDLPAQSSVFNFYPLILILLVGILSYSNTLHSPFVFDDLPNIVERKGIHLDNLSASELTQLKHGMRGNRPVAMFSFALNYYFGRLNPFGYHLINLFIHLLSAILVYLLLTLSLNLPSLQERYGKFSREIALLTSLLFVAHPIQTQAVTYIVQRMASMAALFFLLALYCYSKARLTRGRQQTAYLAGTILATLLALGSKEIAATLPFFIALYEYCFWQQSKQEQTQKKLRYIIIGITLLAGILVGVYFAGSNFTAWLNRRYQKYPFTPGQRMLTQLRVVIFYLSLLVAPLPSRLNLDHHFPLSYSLLHPPTTLFCLLLVLGLIGSSIYLAKKRPLISFALIWFWGNLVIESTFLPIELIYEHRLYLPSVGFFLLISILLAKGVGKLTAQPQTKPRIKAGVFLALIISLSLMTYQRNKIWQDDLVLWKDTVSKSPDKARPNYNLGHIYADRGQWAKAVTQYQRTLKLDPEYPGVHNNLGNIYLQQGKSQQAIAEFQQEMKATPNDARLHNNLANAYLNQGLTAKAITHFQRALQIEAGLGGVHNRLGNIYSRQGKPERAAAEFLQEIKHHPDNANARYNLGYIYSQQGKMAEAASQFQQALKINPGLTQARHNLEIIYRQQPYQEKAKPPSP